MLKIDNKDVDVASMTDDELLALLNKLTNRLTRMTRQIDGAIQARRKSGRRSDPQWFSGVQTARRVTEMQISAVRKNIDMRVTRRKIELSFNARFRESAEEILSTSVLEEVIHAANLSI